MPPVYLTNVLFDLCYNVLHVFCTCIQNYDNVGPIKIRLTSIWNSRNYTNIIIFISAYRIFFKVIFYMKYNFNSLITITNLTKAIEK